MKIQRLLVLLSIITFNLIYSRKREVVKLNFERLYLPPIIYSFVNSVIVNQVINQPGAVQIKGNFIKPVTNVDIIVSVKYCLGPSSIWTEVGCNKFLACDNYNGDLSTVFELPASSISNYDIKLDLESNSNNPQNIICKNDISDYILGDYIINPCEQGLQENKYTKLLAPISQNTFVTNVAVVIGLKDCVNSTQIFNKKNDILFKINKPAILNTDVNGAKNITINNNGTNTDMLVNTPEIIYNTASIRPIFYLYSYNDPNGIRLHNFRNPNAPVNRYFNLYNNINQKISNLFTDQEPIIIVSRKHTGLSIFKQNGSFIQIKERTNYSPISRYFGFPPDQGDGMRVPGSENFIIFNTSKFSLYGMGSIRNNQFGAKSLPLTEKENEVKKFIKYVSIFGNTTVINTNRQNKCVIIKINEYPDFKPLDWLKVPNSYIFNIKSIFSDGLFIPIKKAYTNWNNDQYIGNFPIPLGATTADVIWENNHRLVKSGVNYALEIVGTREYAKIKFPLNKLKEGNVDISYKVNGTVYWSWCIWITDDPKNGSKYKSYNNIERELPTGSAEVIPHDEWKWIDRNLSAIAITLTEAQSIKNVGLLYHWGKDEKPPLAFKGGDFYEVSSSIGRIRHRESRNIIFANIIESYAKYLLLNYATVTNNLLLSVNNPLSLIYIYQNDNTGQELYNNPNLPINWFVTNTTLSANNLSELNLWSDDSKGLFSYGYNEDSNVSPYRQKSLFDTCPNGWKIPSMLVAYLASNSYIDDIRLDFSPFGVRTNMRNKSFTDAKYYIINPNDNKNPSFIKRIKVYPNIGMDFSDVDGFNMGIYPGNGEILRGLLNGQYSVNTTLIYGLQL